MYDDIVGTEYQLSDEDTKSTDDKQEWGEAQWLHSSARDGGIISWVDYRKMQSLSTEF